MSGETSECGHRCRNTCAMLQEGLKKELGEVAYFERLAAECEDPEVKKFTESLIQRHRALAVEIDEKLNIIRSQAGILDEIIDSYES